MSEKISVSIKGKKLVCMHCGNEQFLADRGQLITPLKSFLNIEWAGPTADVFVCANCGFLHWFLKRDSMEYMVEDQMELDSECLSCGGTIPSGTDVCPKCGWTYRN